MSRQNDKFDGAFLRKIRKQAGLTQAELSRKLGISRDTIIAVEKSRDGTIDDLGIVTVRDWIEACEEAPYATVSEVMDYVKSFLKIR